MKRQNTDTESVFSTLTKISPSFAELEPMVDGMTPEGKQQAIVHIAGFLKATESYRATMKQLGLDDDDGRAA